MVAVAAAAELHVLSSERVPTDGRHDLTYRDPRYKLQVVLLSEPPTRANSGAGASQPGSLLAADRQKRAPLGSRQEFGCLVGTPPPSYRYGKKRGLRLRKALFSRVPLRPRSFQPALSSTSPAVASTPCGRAASACNCTLRHRRWRVGTERRGHLLQCMFKRAVGPPVDGLSFRTRQSRSEGEVKVDLPPPPPPPPPQTSGYPSRARGCT